MSLREGIAGLVPPMDAGPGGNAGKPRGAGMSWPMQGQWPYADPSVYEPDEQESEELAGPRANFALRFASRIGSVVPRRDMGYTRSDAGNFLGPSGTFNPLEEGGVGFMPNSIVPLVHFNRMTNRTQDLNAPAEIPNITSGPGIKNRTGTVYGTSHASILAGDEEFSFNPGAGDVLPNRDERGLIKATRLIQRFNDLQRKKYGSAHSSSSRRPVIVGEWK